jgi:hypothetical protein
MNVDESNGDSIKRLQEKSLYEKQTIMGDQDANRHCAEDIFIIRFPDVRRSK